MPLVSTNQPNLINGVSQQADSLKFPTQAIEQINGYSSVVEGLTKRNPSRNIAKLTNAVNGTPFVHQINRDTNERYQVIIQDGSVRVFDMSGVEKTVTAPYGFSYLNGITPQTVRAITIADYTFILNTSKVAAMSGSTTSSATSDASIFIQQGGYSIGYTVTVGGTSESITSGTAANAATNSSTEVIAEQIRAKLAGNTTINASYNIVRNGSLIYITHKTGGTVDVDYKDSVGNTYGKVANDVATNLASLPSVAKSGQLVKITGGTDSPNDDYWVKFVPDGNVTYGTGRWTETVAPGITFKFDEATMPHVLIRLANGNFLFSKADGTTQSGYVLPNWGQRKYGTIDSNPDPSFIGKTINDIALFRGRLAFASGENIILSEAGVFSNFFRTSLQSLLDADPVDVAVTSSKVSVIYSIVPFSEKLLLFSDQNQFSLTSADILTPKTVSIQQTTEFTNYRYTKPISVGKTVHFPFTRGDYSGVMEYFVSPLTSLFDGVDITAPVAKYLMGNITKLAVANNEQLTVVLTDGYPNGLYVYKYFYNGEEKIQSSWSKWEFDAGCTILNADFIDSTLYLTIKRNDGVYLEKVNIEAGYKDLYSDFTTRLDRRVTEAYPGLSIAYNSSTDISTVTLPYQYNGADTIQLVTRDVSSNTNVGGKVLPVIQGTDPASYYTTFTTKGDVRNTKFYTGLVYDMSYKFSTPLIRASNGQSRVAVTDGRLQVKSGNLTYSNSLYFSIIVTPKYRDPYTYVFTGPRLGTGGAIIGDEQLVSGAYRFPIMAKNDMVEVVIHNDSPFPCSLLSMDWESWYHVRNQRLG